MLCVGPFFLVPLALLLGHGGLALVRTEEAAIRFMGSDPEYAEFDHSHRSPIKDVHLWPQHPAEVSSWWRRGHSHGRHLQNLVEPKRRTHSLGENWTRFQTRMLRNKPAIDKRLFQYTRLENDLTVLNVQDPATDKAAFAAAVTAGTFYDPANRGGLAHLTEHVLFLGTSGYPERSGFDRFLARHWGSSNAFTEEEKTVYYASLHIAGFKEGLERFADMFRAPLLNESSVWQEVSAVSSEHSKNTMNPAWYSQRVMMSVADPANPAEHFHTGDNISLRWSGPSSLKEDMKSYFDANYCPPRMHVVTFANFSLLVQDLYVKAAFGNIPRLGGSSRCDSHPKVFAMPPAFPRSHVGKWLLVKGPSPSASLWMLFPMSDLRPWHRSHPLNFVKYAISFAGEGSLLLVLRDQLELADHVGLSAEDTSAGTMVWITVGLTPFGAGKTSLVMEIIFTYLAQVQRCVRMGEIIQSLASSARLLWDWATPATGAKLVSDLAETMTRLPHDELLSSDTLTEENNATHVIDVLKQMIPTNVDIGLIRPDAAQLWGNTTPRRLPHYNLDHVIYELGDWDVNYTTWGKWLNESDPDGVETYAALAVRLRDGGVDFDGPLKINLPGVITDIPVHNSLSDAQAVKGNTSLEALWGVAPTKIDSTIGRELWYRKGWTLAQPKVLCRTAFRSHNSPNMTPAWNIVLLQTGMQLLAEELDMRLNDVGYKGFGYSVAETSTGMYVEIRGFKTDLMNLTTRLITEFSQAMGNVDLVRLARVVADLKSGYESGWQMPIKEAFTDQRVLLTPKMHAKSELHQAMVSGPNITWEMARSSVLAARVGPFSATTIVMGNYPEADARTIHEKVIGGIGATTGVNLTTADKVSKVVKPATCVEIRRWNPRAGDNNHATLVTVLVGPATVENRVVLGLLGVLFSQVAFEELRTKAGLGYIAGGIVTELSTVLMVTCYVQGERMLPDLVEAQCERVFTKTMPAEINKLTRLTFAGHKAAFNSSLLARPQSPWQEASHFEDPILLADCFGLKSAMLKYLDTINNKSQLLKAWRDAMMPMNGTAPSKRKKVVTKLYGRGLQVIPKTPTASEAKAYVKNSTGDSHSAQRVYLERGETLVLSEANSTTRDILVKAGGFYPSNLNCELGSHTATMATNARGSDTGRAHAEGADAGQASTGAADDTGTTPEPDMVVLLDEAQWREEKEDEMDGAGLVVPPAPLPPPFLGGAPKSGILASPTKFLFADDDFLEPSDSNHLASVALSAPLMPSGFLATPGSSFAAEVGAADEVQESEKVTRPDAMVLDAAISPALPWGKNDGDQMRLLSEELVASPSPSLRSDDHMAISVAASGVKSLIRSEVDHGISGSTHRARSSQRSGSLLWPGSWPRAPAAGVPEPFVVSAVPALPLRLIPVAPMAAAEPKGVTR